MPRQIVSHPDVLTSALLASATLLAALLATTTLLATTLLAALLASAPLLATTLLAALLTIIFLVWHFSSPSVVR